MIQISHSNKILGISFVVSMTCLIAMVSSCIGVSGKLSPNPVLLEQFRTHAISGEYNFYYCGRSNIPYAVVGIDPSYEFDGKFWHGINTMDEVYKKIDNLSDLHPRAQDMAGSDILDRNGRRIGIWFSFYRHTPVQIDAENRKVTVMNPYNPNEDEGFSSFNAGK